MGFLQPSGDDLSDLIGKHAGEPGVLIGNGMSRLNVSLPACKEWGVTFGCNALYRHFEPHYLIAGDTRMIVEIAGSNYGGTVLFNEKHEPSAARKFKNGSKRLPGRIRCASQSRYPYDQWWRCLSGHFALRLAVLAGCSPIVFVGMDFGGFKSNKINNCYTSSRNYSQKGTTDPLAPQRFVPMFEELITTLGVPVYQLRPEVDFDIPTRLSQEVAPVVRRLEDVPCNRTAGLQASE